MPGSILNADTKFPHFTGHEKPDDKVEIIMNYLQMLYEQLRYSMGNLGVENFNTNSIDELSKLITEPVYIRLSDAEGRLTTLTTDVTGIHAAVNSVEGDIAQLFVTTGTIAGSVSALDGRVTTVVADVNGVITRVGTAEGNISQIQQDVSGITSRVTTAEGNISTITQNATALTARVTTAEGNISGINTSISGIDTRLGAAEADVAELEVGLGGITSRVGTVEGSVNSVTQTLNGVVFYDSDAGKTVINGSNITTGKIAADRIDSDNLYAAEVHSRTTADGGGLFINDGVLRTYYGTDIKGWLTTNTVDRSGTFVLFKGNTQDQELVDANGRRLYLTADVMQIGLDKDGKVHGSIQANWIGADGMQSGYYKTANGRNIASQDANGYALVNPDYIKCSNIQNADGNHYAYTDSDGKRNLYCDKLNGWEVEFVYDSNIGRNVLAIK